MKVSQFRGLRAAWIDHDDRPPRIAGDLPQHRTRPCHSMRLPRVLPDEDRDLGLLEIPGRVIAVQLLIDPGLAGLLLRECIGHVPHAQCMQECAAVCPAEVIALTAATVVEDLVAAVPVLDYAELRRDLVEGG